MGIATRDIRPPDESSAFLNIAWQNNDGPFQLGETRGVLLEFQSQNLQNLAANSDLYNNRSLAYRLTRTLALPKSGVAAVNVDDLLEGGGMIPYDLSREEMINGLVMVAVHEPGHALALAHGGDSGAEPGKRGAATRHNSGQPRGAIRARLCRGVRHAAANG